MRRDDRENLSALDLSDAEEAQALDAIADDVAREDALTRLHHEADDDQPTYGGPMTLRGETGQSSTRPTRDAVDGPPAGHEAKATGG
jgi:hypothetical protein